MSRLIGTRADLPPNDPIALAARYRVTEGTAAPSRAPGPEPSLGAIRSFNVLLLTGGALTGTAPPSFKTIDATLRAKTEHAYFYVDTALAIDQADADEAARAFEEQVWPGVTSVFGLPPTPGVDGDPRIIILQSDLGGAVGGYHLGDDRYLRALRPNSNEAEMVYMDRTLRLGGDAFNVVLAHELQHLIHARNDDDEEAWVNEGLSETASSLVGGSVSSVNSFAASPETQLNAWTTQGSLPHYGAGAAFFRYLAGRFGGESVLGEIARQPADGEAGIDAWLASRGQALTFRDVFADWIAANWLNLPEGPYGNLWRTLNVDVAGTLAAGDAIDSDATQYGAQYYRLDVSEGGGYTLDFSGQQQTPVLPAAGQGTLFLWSNAGDMIDTTLTREVDLTGVAAPMLTFRTWYDIERWFDLGYVAVSTDDGASWTAVAGEHSSNDDPLAISLGPAYTGKSGGEAAAAWVNESIDLAAYAGQRVLVRFEYVTDEAAHGEGWAIDDISIAGTPTPLDDPGWTSNGWVLVDEPLRQSYIVRVVGERDGAPVVLDLPPDGRLSFDATGLRDPVVVVAGATEGTRETAPYDLSLGRTAP